jgi:hypothetical protein
MNKYDPECGSILKPVNPVYEDKTHLYCGYCGRYVKLCVYCGEPTPRNSDVCERCHKGELNEI